jgi:hypothetical protein
MKSYIRMMRHHLILRSGTIVDGLGGVPGSLDRSRRTGRVS